MFVVIANQLKCDTIKKPIFIQYTLPLSNNWIMMIVEGGG
jgi:hypothetical protein